MLLHMNGKFTMGKLKLSLLSIIEWLKKYDKHKRKMVCRKQKNYKKLVDDVLKNNNQRNHQT
jgi:hypothetical protein